MQNPTSKQLEAARNLFKAHRGILKTHQALELGIHRRTLYGMHAAGVIDRLCRGVYRLADLPPLSNPDWVALGLTIPRGVICLISALAFHELTTQIPREIWVALPRGAEPPRLKTLPLRVVWFTGAAFTEGIEEHTIDGVNVRVYSAEKTLADAFKYRNKLGMDTVLEAFRLYRERNKPRFEALMRYARICRVERVMRPYLEAVI